MHLSRLSVRNFRAFAEAELALPETGLVFVVGANNSGKSALLSALDVVAGESPAGARRSGAQSPAVVRGRFVLNEHERVRFFGSRDEALLRSGAFRELEYELQDFRDERFYLAAVRATQADGDLAVIGEVQDLSEGGSGRIAATPLPGWFTAGPVDRPYALEVRRQGGGVIDMLASDLPIIAELRNAWGTMLYHFRALRTGTTRARTLAAAETLDPSGINLPEALLYLFTRDDPAWHEISAVMRKSLPDAGSLITPADGGNVEVALIDPFSGTRRNIKYLGTGVEQFLLSAYLGVRQPAGGVVIIEEPETNLHAGAQRELLRRLRRWAGDRLFVCSTHSSVFLDQGAEESLVYLVERNEGTSTVRQAETDLPGVLQSIGVRLSRRSQRRAGALRRRGDRCGNPPCVAARGRPLVEYCGPPRWWRRRASHMEMVDKLFGVADRLARRVLFVRDRDEMDDASVDRLEKTGIVWVLPVRELENFMLDAPAVASVLRDRLHAQGEAARRDVASPAEIEQIWRTAADGLKSQIILKNVAYLTRLIRPLDRDTVSSLVDNAPSLEAAEEAVRRNVPTADTVVDELRTTWTHVASAIEENWQERWQAVAPGTELLEVVWKKHGLSYNKWRDGLLVAEAMAEPPAQLVGRLRRFLSGRQELNP